MRKSLVFLAALLITGSPAVIAGVTAPHDSSALSQSGAKITPPKKAQDEQKKDEEAKKSDETADRKDDKR